MTAKAKVEVEVHLPRSSLRQPVDAVATESDAELVEAGASRSQIIAAIVGSLAIDPGRRPSLSAALERLAIQHGSMAYILDNPLEAKTRRARLTRLIKNLRDAQELSRDLLLGTKLAVNDALKSGPGPASPLMGFERDLRTVYETLCAVREIKKKAGRRSLVNLGHLVGALTLLLQLFTGKRPVAYHGSPDEGKEPVFRSKEALAILRFVQHLEPGTTDVTVLNLIMKIRRNYSDEQLRSTFEPSIMAWRVTGFIETSAPH